MNLKQNDNIIECHICGIALIAEEISIHECFKFRDMWIMDEEIWVGNGKKYYNGFSNHHPISNTQMEHP